MSKYMSLEQTIRRLGAKGVSQPLEKDMNDQVHAGAYSSKHFEVSAPAQKLYASLPKDTDPDKAEKSVQLHDKLFAIHKKTVATERSTSADQDEAQRLHDEIMSLAKEMGLEDKHGHVKDSLDYIKKYVDTQSNTKDDIKPEDVAKRFATPPKDYQNDVKADADIDNIQQFRISRDKKAQRKLKIIDDEFNLGVENMDRIEKVSVSFLEALKQVKSNAEALEEKKKMTKADIAALKEPKGKFDEKDLAALRAGEHKKVKEEVEKEEKNEKEENDDGWYAHKEMHGSKAVSKEDWKKGYRLNSKGEKVKKSNEEVEQVDEAQFIVIQKGMTKKRVRNNPDQIAKARREGWAIQENTETVEEGNEMQNLAKSQKAATVKRELQQKKQMFAKKDATDKAKFAKAMQKEDVEAVDEVSKGKLLNYMGGASYDKSSHASDIGAINQIARTTGTNAAQRDERDKLSKKHGNRSLGIQRAAHKLANKNVKVPATEEFIERAIAVLGESFKDASFEQLVEEVVKRGRGRPRKDGSSSAPKSDDAGDREHIVVALRKAISLRGDHGVKFADGSTHKISADHAQKALKMHDNLSKPSEKMSFQRKLGASHSSFKNALDDKSPGSQEKEKSKITLAKKAEL